MTIRTSEKTVVFGRPFVLDGVGETLPPGAYTVETDEQPLEGVSFLAWQRVLTLIHLRAKSGTGALTRALKIDPNDLAAALKRDQAPADDPVAPDGPKAGREAPTTPGKGYLDAIGKR